ncbi:uncharacterized protein LOC106155364 isoform X2 [Lingula anatina]|uniref:Uncharacterized protein LOC106155364 isoform X2 n=1 Tax=Lingula anatina TaxID=7574 RepID=A0A1S3HKS9_LINAN|nr:uncharacterized protein LOC106155364 isoform X2 [Lingula anatina]|eukprot:XP_013385614.2 uncharacterized protein LOC106155364 isoform X2 [Lingula anatina]
MKTFDLPTTYANNTMIVKAATIFIPTLLGLASLGILFLRRRKNQNGWLSRKSVPLNDKSNFFRLTRLLLDFGGNVLRDFLSREMQKKYPNDFDPTSGNMRGVLTKVQSILCNMPKKIFNDSQRDFCYPGGTPATNVFLDDIDITLAGVLLRNITTLSPNSSKWSKPSATDTDPIALLSRFRTYRNIFHGHASNAAIETTPFLKLFHEIKDLLLGLSTVYSKADYLSLLEEPLDSNLVAKNSELFERWIHVQNMPIEEVEHRLSDRIVKELRYLRETTNNGFERMSQLLNGAGNQLLPQNSIQAGGVPKTEETPTSRDVPTTGETPTAGDVPTTGETPATGDVPTSGETPTTGDVPTTGETPTTGDFPTSGETPATGGVQTTGETPTTGVVPTTGETPTIKDLSTENHTNIEVKATEEKPSARVIPTNSTTEVIYKREKYSPAESSPFFRAIEVLHTDNVMKAEAEEACEVEIKPCTEEFYETFANDPDVYSNTSTPRGRAVIINNEMYSCGNLRNRTGTDADSETLQNLLYQLQYRVQVHHDLSSEVYAQ